MASDDSEFLLERDLTTFGAILPAGQASFLGYPVEMPEARMSHTVSFGNRSVETISAYLQFRSTASPTLVELADGALVATFDESDPESAELCSIEAVSLIDGASEAGQQLMRSCFEANDPQLAVSIITLFHFWHIAQRSGEENLSALLVVEKIAKQDPTYAEELKQRLRRRDGQEESKPLDVTTPTVQVAWRSFPAA